MPAITGWPVACKAIPVWRELTPLVTATYAKTLSRAAFAILVDRRTARHDQLGHQDSDDLVPLVACLAADCDHATVRAGPGWLDLDDLALDPQDVAGTGGLRPANLTSRRLVEPRPADPVPSLFRIVGEQRCHGINSCHDHRGGMVARTVDANRVERRSSLGGRLAKPE